VVVDGGAVVASTGGGASDVDAAVVGWVTDAVVPGETGAAAAAAGDAGSGEAAGAGRGGEANGSARDPRAEVGATGFGAEVLPWFAAAVGVVALGSVSGPFPRAGGGAGSVGAAATRLDWLCGCSPPCWYATARPRRPPPARSTARKISGNRRFSVMSEGEPRISSA
jgi:hypothetical protein